ncbi:MAG: rRNA pseudouridine synthase [Synergistaceae bacterium]|nr:rRNA pseudouridine synthase [Synergistaceae bacterium]
MRLNAFIASCGVASRRKAENIILSGRVQVNGKIVLAPFFQVDPENDSVTLDRKPLTLSEHAYYVINKPAGYVCAASDKYDPVVVDLIPEHSGRLYPVGRLDRESEGLLILTNDGSFTQSILHPSKQIHKEYEALLNIPINAKQLSRWRKGFEILEGHHVVPVSVEILDREPVNQWLSIVIVEGLKREVRLMAREAGFRVERLIRRRIGNMVLENLNVGEYAGLSFSELYSKIFDGGIV